MVKKNKQNQHQAKKSRQGQVSKHSPKNLPSKGPDPELLDKVKKNMEYYSDKIAEDGYRIVGFAQALIDYAKPLIYETKSQEDMNKAMKFAQLCWNIGASERSQPETIGEIEREIAKFDYPDIEKMIDKMLVRFRLMFPEVGLVPSFYIKERVLDTDIEEFESFDESTLQIKEDVIPPTEDEIKLAETLRIFKGMDDDEDKLEEWKYNLLDCYGNWCLEKGVPEDKIRFIVVAIDHFMEFLYKHHGEFLSNDIPVPVIQEFMRVYYIRKIWTTSWEKNFMPYAMKLFMKYLDEKKFITGTKYLTRIIESEQSFFLRNLKLYTNPALEKNS